MVVVPKDLFFLFLRSPASGFPIASDSKQGTFGCEPSWTEVQETIGGQALREFLEVDKNHTTNLVAGPFIDPHGEGTILLLSGYQVIPFEYIYIVLSWISLQNQATIWCARYGRSCVCMEYQYQVKTWFWRRDRQIDNLKLYHSS